MKIDLGGATVIGAYLTLDKDSHIYNARLVECIIDDVDATHQFSTNCTLVHCKLRSASSAFETLDITKGNQ